MFATQRKLVPSLRLLWCGKQKQVLKCNFLLSWCETNMNTPLKILGIAGSLRKKSYNRFALRAAQQLTPEGAIIETFELGGIPFDRHIAVIDTDPLREGRPMTGRRQHRLRRLGRAVFRRRRAHR